jgi:hypothetical protein
MAGWELSVGKRIFQGNFQLSTNKITGKEIECKIRNYFIYEFEFHSHSFLGGYLLWVGKEYKRPPMCCEVRTL